MTLMLIPTMERPAPRVIPTVPFVSLASLSRADLVATREIAAAERRSLLPTFVQTFAWEAIRPHLPLRLELPPDRSPLARPHLPVPLRLAAPGGPARARSVGGPGRL